MTEPQESSRWTVREPALAALLAGWTGKLLITSRTRSASASPPRHASPARLNPPGLGCKTEGEGFLIPFGRSGFEHDRGAVRALP